MHYLANKPLETEKLLKKVENQITREEEKRRQNDQVNTLYEQAHGLLRSKKWRNALDKMEEIRKLDDLFPDTDGIAEKAQKELTREEQEAERQNKLAALYAEAVHLLKDEKYQEALDKWHEVRAIDAIYPDQKMVEKTARTRLGATPRPLLKKEHGVSKTNWFRLGLVGFVVFTIIGVIAIFFPGETVHDDFDNPFYRNSYNNLNWTAETSNSRNYAVQSEDGVLRLVNFGYDNYMDLIPKKYAEKTLTTPTFIKSYFMQEPGLNGGVGIVVRINKLGAYVTCYIWGDGEMQTLICEAVNFGEYKEITNKPVDSGSWHTAHIDVDTSTPLFTFNVDGVNLGSYSPPQTEPYKSVQYSLFITSFCSGSGCVDMDIWNLVEGVFDYVEIGPVR